MSKRPIQNAIHSPTMVKRTKIEEINAVKDIILRNDDGPHIICDIDCEFVKVGNYIYKVKPYDESWMDSGKLANTISITPTQYNDLFQYIVKNRIAVTNYEPDYPIIRELTIDLSCDLIHSVITKRFVIADDIRRILEGHVVSIGQNFCMSNQGFSFNIAINKLDMRTMGLVSRFTEIAIKNASENIIIYDNCIIVDSKSVEFIITSCIDVGIDTSILDFNSGEYKFPLLLPNDLIRSYVRDAFDNLEFTHDDTVVYTVDGLDITFKTNVLGVNNEVTGYMNTYVLNESENLLNIRSAVDNVIICDDTMRADKITFAIEPVKQIRLRPVRTAASTGSTGPNQIIVEDRMDYFIRENIEFVVQGQSFKYKNRNTEYILRAKLVYPNSFKKIMYNIDLDTKIKFEVSANSNYIIVKNQVPLKISKVTFKIQKEEVLSLFANLNRKTHKLKSSQLKKKIKLLFPTKTAVGQRMKYIYDSVNYDIIVKELCFVNGESETKSTVKRHGTLGLITSKTKFHLKISKRDKDLIRLTANDDDANAVCKVMPNPIAELEKYVGGISSELKVVVRTLCLSRGKLRDEFAVRGLNPSKGIIFHGPPGTGKTTLARNLGKILGCEGDRFKLMSAPEVFNKWVGESEANVRAIFKPAKDAWKKHGAKAPLYMVAIDEIDAMIPRRGNSPGNSVRDTVVNQFLAEMDGLEQFKNLICIGITNRLELLDPAAIRAGRFSTHIKIDLPDKDGRLKIFEIHTRKLVESKRIESNVDFNELSIQTDKFSGADIESVVELASTFSLERLAEMETIDETAINTCGKIRSDDFTKAITEVAQRNNLGSNNLLPMYM